MGLDAYLYYQCPFRPNGSVGSLLETQRLLRMLDVMKKHDVPSVAFQLRGPNGMEERTVTRAQAEQAEARWAELGATCMQCPVGNRRTTPGCQARVDYPLDDVALSVVREALEVNAQDFAPPADRFVRSLLAAGNCDGQRMLHILANLQAAPSAIGRSPVRFVVDGRAVGITPYMALEHVFFRSYLDPVETLALREWYRAFYVAVGNRIAAGPDPDTASKALFGSSYALQDLAGLGALVKQAEQHKLGLVLDG
jgi:hypothetical protein